MSSHPRGIEGCAPTSGIDSSSAITWLIRRRFWAGLHVPLPIISGCPWQAIFVAGRARGARNPPGAGALRRRLSSCPCSTPPMPTRSRCDDRGVHSFLAEVPYMRYLVGSSDGRTHPVAIPVAPVRAMRYSAEGRALHSRALGGTGRGTGVCPAVSFGAAGTAGSSERRNRR